MDIYPLKTVICSGFTHWKWWFVVDLPIENGDLLLFNGTSKCDLMDYEWDIPSGNLLQFAIENDPVEIVDLPIENGGSFHSYVNVYQRVVS